MNAIDLAALHQQSIREKRAQIVSDASCARQLLVGRVVRRKSQFVVKDYTVTEVRLNLSGVLEVRGKLKNIGRTKYIGLIAELEIVEQQT